MSMRVTLLGGGEDWTPRLKQLLELGWEELMPQLNERGERTPLQAAAARCFDRAFTHRVACTYLRGVWPCDCGVLAAGGDGPSPPERLAVRQSLR